MSGEEVLLTRAAYCKMFLHASRYATSGAPCSLGFLIGSVQSHAAPEAEGGIDSTQSNPRKFHVVDVLPVLHSIPAGPILDIALPLADGMHASNSVIGVYYSNGYRDSDESLPFINRVTKTIAARSEFCLVAQFKQALIMDESKLAIGITNRGGAVSIKTADSVSDINSAVDRLLADGWAQRVFDLEAHMELASNDYKNLALEGAINAAF